MDMEESSAAAAAQGDLADVVACANAIASSSTATHHHPPLPPPPAAAAAAHMSHRYPAGAQIMVPNYDDARRRQPMSGGGDAVMFEGAPVIDPYLHSNSSGYGLPTHHHHDHHQQQQLAAVQISSQHACCGLEGGLDVDGDDAMMMMRISPPLTTPAAQHHQMMKRKSEVRKVVCIPAPPPPTSGRAGGGGEAVIPSDLWAWRKYGQKPIKGSPYPRGYYRCSSSKGCLARKQVERSRSDPNMLVITYTAEHNHPWPMQRNVLAGYARAHSTHAASGVSSSSASKKHKTSNVAASSSNNSSSHHGGYSVDDHPEQDAMIGGDQLTVAADNMMAVAGDDGSVGIGVQPTDEVFAELEELLETDNSMVNANIMCSKGVSYEWHKF